MKKLVNQNSSFEEIYNEYHNPLLNWLKFKIKNASDAEELVNDTLIKVCRNLDKFDASKSSFDTWVKNVNNNVLIDYYRTNNMTAKAQAMKSNFSIDGSDVNEDCPVFQVPDKGVKSDSLFDTQIVARNIASAIDSLKGNFKAIAIEHFVNELTYGEIVEKLDLPLNTVKVTILRVREKLQNKLKKEYELVC